MSEAVGSLGTSVRGSLRIFTPSRLQLYGYALALIYAAALIHFPDYALSSAIKSWYKTGTYGCFCGFERWRATRCNFKRGSARPSLLFFTEQRISAGRVMRWRWPSGFVCPVCAGEHHSFIKTRALYQCTCCRRQTSVIAGTIFAATKVPLCTWFRAMYHLTQSKGGISSI